MKKPTAQAAYAFLLLCFVIISSCRKTENLAATPFPIKVIATNPESHQENSLTDCSVTAALNAAIDTAEFSVALTVSKNDTLVNGLASVHDSIVSFVPEAELSPSSAYTACLSITKKQKEQLPLYSYKWQFFTKEADAYKMTKRSDHVTDFVRDGSRAMQMGNSYFSYGGWNVDEKGNEHTYNDVYRSTGDLSSWEKLPNAPWFSRHVFGCVKKDGKVWVLGGDNLNSNFDVWNSADGVNWTKIGATNPEPVGQRMYIGVCTHKTGNREWLYIIGGVGHKDVLRSLDGITWEVVADNLSFLAGAFPSGDGFASSLASLNGKLYLICGGGGIDNGPPRKTVYRSLDNGATWQKMEDFPGKPRRYTDVITFDNKIWMVGGYDDFEIGNLDDIWYLSNDGTWHQFPVAAGYIGRHATGVGVWEYGGKKSLVITCGNYNNDCWVIEKTN